MHQFDRSADDSVPVTANVSFTFKLLGKPRSARPTWTNLFLNLRSCSGPISLSRVRLVNVCLYKFALRSNSTCKVPADSEKSSRIMALLLDSFFFFYYYFIVR